MLCIHIYNAQLESSKLCILSLFLKYGFQNSGSVQKDKQYHNNQADDVADSDFTFPLKNSSHIIYRCRNI